MGEEIGASVEIIQLMKRKSDLDQERSMREPVIYKANPRLKNEKKGHYESTVISLGLFDRRSWDCCGGVTKEKDPLKKDVLIAFLADTGKELKDWAEISKEVVVNARDMESRYDQSLDCRIPAEETIRSALALDSIFVTCFLMFYFERECPEIRLMSETSRRLDRESTDVTENLFLDILKMENQLPLVLIQNVLGIIFSFLNLDSVANNPDEESAVDKKIRKICSRVIQICKASLPSDQPSPYNANIQNYHHLLHFAAEGMWDRARDPISRSSNSARDFLPTAKELHEVGVTFEGHHGIFPKFKQTKFIRWPWKATLFLPRIRIDDYTETYWRNFVAFDNVFPLQRRLQHHQQRPFQDYFSFMDNLVDTKKDVSLLLQGKNPVILGVGIGDNQAVANLFNSMMINVVIVEDNSDEWFSIMKEISDFHNNAGGNKLAELRKTYFSKPWALISVCAAIILLVLTFLQTFYTMRYHD